MRFTVRVGGMQSLDALAERLDRAAAGGLQRDLIDAVRAEAGSVVPQVRAAWRGIEVTSTRGGGSTSGLRGRAAAATHTQPIPDGVRFEVDGAAIDPAYGRSLAWLLDGIGTWTHPVFGHRARTTQAGQEVFRRTIAGAEPQWRARLERVVDRTTREIEGRP